jgi:predicted kinase
VKTDSFLVMLMICHLLIGVPGSGKSSFAAQLATLGGYRVVSTDAIREQLYGDMSIQGDWREIEARVFADISEAIALGEGVIYDATNARRAWRMDLLQKLNSLAGSPDWMGWYLRTPVKICWLWNQKRSRQVPDPVLENMHKSLAAFPPVAAEGFCCVKIIDVSSPRWDFSQIPGYISQVNRSVVNRVNRNCHITLHRYSGLADFERLMYLLALILRFPGVGNLQGVSPSLLANILGRVAEFDSPAGEITACMAKLYGNIYAQPEAIARDLQWLQANFFIAVNSIPQPWSVAMSLPAPVTQSITATHSYSDFSCFQRLMQVIRFILHYPFLRYQGEASFASLVTALTKHGIIDDDGCNSVRKDIEKVLKPYRILPDFPMRDGYFAGTAILSADELVKVFQVLESQAQSLNDPIALDIYERFATRMAESKLAVNEVYPVRAIANRSMINLEYLPDDALVNNLPQLEQAIANRELIELNRFPGGGKFALDEEGFFLAFPLQIIFSNTAWYLGYECQSGKYAGLFRFERLDRLFFGHPQKQTRSLQEQQKALDKLQKLATASAGIFLGYSVNDQRLFLSHEPQERHQVSVTVELWFNDHIYRFITEGTQRFPPRQMKMSPPVQKGKLKLPKSLFCLQKTKDEQFPNCFRVVLPQWSLDDVELIRWIMGFGGSVKVVKPPALVDKIKNMGEAIFQLYQ